MSSSAFVVFVCLGIITLTARWTPSEALVLVLFLVLLGVNPVPLVCQMSIPLLSHVASWPWTWEQLFLGWGQRSFIYYSPSTLGISLIASCCTDVHSKGSGDTQPPLSSMLLCRWQMGCREKTEKCLRPWVITTLPHVTVSTPASMTGCASTTFLLMSSMFICEESMELQTRAKGIAQYNTIKT